MNLERALPKIDIDHVQLIRIFTIIPVVLIFLAGASAIWMYFFVSSLLPEGQSLVETPGLSAKVSVFRDAKGIPSIISETEDDLALVLGYVMAQDRLWQMDYLRRTGQGRLAEILGPRYLESDHLVRTMKAGRSRNDATGELSDAEKRWLHKFVQGINRYIANHQGKLPLEFSVLEYMPSYFSSDDIMAILDALALETSIALRVDPVMTRILGLLGKERALELFPADPAAPPAEIASDLLGWEPKGLLFSPLVMGHTVTGVAGLRGGSGWAVSHDKSRSGKALSSCCFYQPLTAPGFWYRARLATEDFRLSGAFIPGVPVVMAGANHHFGWGCFSCPADDADLYIERLDSDEARGYFRVDRFLKMEEINEKYRVRGGASVSRSILLTDLGPIVSDVNRSRALSCCWTGQKGLALFPALFNLNRATDLQHLQAALAGLVAPCLNVVWADTDNNFGIQTAGRIPIRPSGCDGIVPMPAWTGTYNWLGFIPFHEMPSETNPAKGLAVVSDGRPGGLDYPFFVSCYWSEDYRQTRIKELLEDSKDHSLESFSRIQEDTFSFLGANLAPLIVAATDGLGKPDSTDEQAAKILKEWDFQMSRDSAGAAIFGLTYNSLVENTLLKTLGNELYVGFTNHYPLAARFIKKVFVDHKSKWLTRTDPTVLLAESFQQAMLRGKALMGDNPAKWRWGEIHTAVFRHPVSTRSRFLEALYHVGPLPTSGAWDTINCSGWSSLHPFEVTEGTSFKQFADMGQPPLVFGINPLGSSAHFFSPHYKDQTSIWITGKSLQDPSHKADITRHDARPVLFRPPPGGTLSLQ